jgi:dihydrofolate reductase
VGAIIVGMRSYEIGIEKGWFKNNAYGSSPIFVVCKQKPKTISKDADFRFITEGIEAAHKEASKAADGKFIYIFGGPSIFQQLLNKDLVDEMWITVAPILLGKGIRLFDNLSERRIDLQQLKVEAHPNSMYEVHYRVLKHK